MHLLFLLPTSPLPISSGGHQRMYQILRCLAPRHNITLLSFWRTEEAFEGLRQLKNELDIEVIPVAFTRMRHPSRLLVTVPRLASALLRNQPLDVPIWDQPTMSVALQKALDDHPVDLIQAEFAYLSPYVFAHPHIPRMLTLYEVFYAYFNQNANLSTSRWSRQFYRLQARAWRAYEQSVFPRYDMLGAMSAVDADVVLRLSPHANVRIFPNGVDTEAINPCAIRPQAQQLLFVGSPNRGANVDGARWFLSSVWPVLHQRHPHLRCLLVNLDNPSVREQLRPGVEICGRVPDLTPLYTASDIVIVPLLAGTGTRIKILEAFAYGLPVVSTSVGHEGLDVVPGHHLLQADSDSQFVDAVESLIRDNETCRSLGANGRKLVVENYDWRAVAERYEVAYAEMLASHQRRLATS